MTRVFVDTVAWLALLNINDALHSPAQEVMNTLRQQNASLITTEFVLLEVANALSSPLIRSKTVTFIEKLRKLPILQIIPASSELFNAGWTLYGQRSDKEWGLTDCSSFALMEQKQIVQAFTYDHHFVQAGFIKLL